MSVARKLSSSMRECAGQIRLAEFCASSVNGKHCRLRKVGGGSAGRAFGFDRLEEAVDNRGYNVAPCAGRNQLEARAADSRRRDPTKTAFRLDVP